MNNYEKVVVMSFILVSFFFMFKSVSAFSSSFTTANISLVNFYTCTTYGANVLTNLNICGASTAFSNSTNDDYINTALNDTGYTASGFHTWQFNITVPNYLSVNFINFTFDGSSASGSYGLGAATYIWNYTSSQWQNTTMFLPNGNKITDNAGSANVPCNAGQQCELWQKMSPFTDNATISNITSGFKDFIQNNQIHIGFNFSTTSDISKLNYFDLDFGYVPGLTQLSNCTDGISTIPTLNYTVLDENTLATISSNVQMTHNILNATGSTPYSFSYYNTSSFANCINPPSATYTDSGVIQYVDNATSPVYTTRYYWFNNLTISNNAQTINLYLIPTAQGSAVSITLKDSNGNIIPGAYISIQKYYPSLNAYRVVEVLPTDSTGTTTAFLQLNVAYYRFVVTNAAGTLLGTLPQQLVTTTAITLNLPSSVINPYLIYGNQITGVVNYSATTQNVSAFYSDTSGYLTSATLTVNQVGALQTFSICSKTNTTLPAAEIDCYIGNATGSTFTYTLTGIVNTSDTIVIKTGTLQYAQTSLLFGDCSKPANATMCQDGAILAFLLIVTLAFGGVVISPPIGLILTIAGLVICNLIGLIAIPLDLIVGVAVVAAIIIYRMRSSG